MLGLQANAASRLHGPSSTRAAVGSPKLVRKGGCVTAVQQQLARCQVLHNPADSRRKKSERQLLSVWLLNYTASPDQPAAGPACLQVCCHASGHRTLTAENPSAPHCIAAAASSQRVHFAAFQVQCISHEPLIRAQLRPSHIKVSTPPWGGEPGRQRHC